MESLEQARWLQTSIKAALWNLRKDWPYKQIDEKEVSFRYDAVEGVLIMALNEANTLVKEWKEA